MNVATEARMAKIIYEKDMYISDTKEQDIVRTCEHERLFLQRIRTGDVKGILERRAQGERAPKPFRLVEDPVKSAEYRVCAFIALAAYAAIEGGLDPPSTYALNDLYLRRLAACKEIAEIQELRDEVELLFARQVNQVQEERSSASYVEKCKLFIDQHLVMPFTLDDIAKALGVNKSYLSRRFGQEAGMRIMEYTRQKRIEAAANMLKYSDKTISAIAANFCFPTQSHFGKWFKTLKGITPLKYRAANQIIEVRGGE
ncbi:MAG: helix-turn-helix transcriptional regulator [Oscillospiraceae bacterium]|nr:helix-turn-helix transcriptional regulator [Oscillospiraceae bacterium]